jgi:Inositol polyphosphate kinase
MNLSTQNAIPMVGQVGGASRHKRTVLTLAPEYVLKPLLPDHRGIREISFYEAIEAVSKNPGTTKTKNFLQSAYAAYLKSANISNSMEQPKQIQASTSSDSQQLQQQQLLQKDRQQSTLSLAAGANRVGEVMDTLALAFAMLIQDRVVMESEVALKDAWKAIKKEAELLHKMCKFIPPYYGILGQPSEPDGSAGASDSCFSVPYSPECPYGVSQDAHLLLQDLTINYKQPCVMDLKMGTETFEPDAPEEKRLRETTKYPQQSIFGFRIVGMRIYDPWHPEADDKGYRFYGKEYGRSLATHEQVRDAIRIFFGGDNSNSSSNASPFVAKINGDDADEMDPGSSSNADKGGETKESSPPSVIITTQNDGATSTATTIRFKAISSISQQIRLIRGWFDDNTMLRFCASSLLIVYEGDVSSTHTPDVTLVRMIDFGRVRRRTGGDPGYRHGLRTLGHLLGDLVDEHADEED